MLLVARCQLLRFTKLFVLCLKGGVLSCLGHAARHTARLQRRCTCGRLRGRAVAFQQTVRSAVRSCGRAVCF